MADKLKESVLEQAHVVRTVLDPTGWLNFSKLSQYERYDLDRVLNGEREVNPISHMRLGAALELVGVKTRVSELDPDTRMIVLDLGKTRLAEIKDWFPNQHHRLHFTKYVCDAVPYTVDMLERIRTVAAKIRRGQKVPRKERIDLKDVPHLKHTLRNHAAQTTSVPQIPPRVVAEDLGDPKRVQRTVDSIYSSINSLSNIAGANVRPDEVSETSKVSIAEACAKLLHNMGVTGDTLQKFQSRRLEGAVDGASLSSILNLFPKTK